jgi:hypothetical protein
MYCTQANNSERFMTMKDLCRYLAVSMQMCIFYVLYGTVKTVPFEGQRCVINLLFRHRSEVRRRRRKSEIMIRKKGEGMQTRNIQFATEFLRILCRNKVCKKTAESMRKNTCDLSPNILNYRYKITL